MKPNETEQNESIFLAFIVEVLMLDNLIWDYADTCIQVARSLRRSELKNVSRSVRILQRDYERMRSRVQCNGFNTEMEQLLSETFETSCKTHLDRLSLTLRNELNKQYPELKKDEITLLVAVQQCITLLDTLDIFGAACDAFIKRAEPTVKHSIIAGHFPILRRAVVKFAEPHYHKSEAATTTARILVNVLNQVNETLQNETTTSKSIESV